MTTKRPKRMKQPPAWMHSGASADYHSIITGPVTARGVVFDGEPFQLGSGDWVVRVVGRAGCFAVEAFSRCTESVG